MQTLASFLLYFTLVFVLFIGISQLFSVMCVVQTMKFCLFIYLYDVQAIVVVDDVIVWCPGTTDLWMWTLSSVYNNEPLMHPILLCRNEITFLIA